ncbi:MAG: hypothetical protein EBQ92_11005 [Proteobacteria bacterium]|jgi:proteic killer suppression protein|nr:hypothetical protein [Pseudomonadota bacterium]
MAINYRVAISRRALKNIETAPQHVVLKLMAWKDGVERFGLFEMRKWPGFHDEPLLGTRQGQRSVRLSRSYRAIYKITKSESHLILIEEVTKHVY